MKASKQEISIAICVIVALVVLFFGIDYLKGINLLKPANYYSATYTNVNGLQESAPVTINGFKVGHVRSINYEYNNPGHVKVEFSLDKELRIPEGSKAVIESDLLGTATVVLHLSQSQQMLAVGTELEGQTASGMMDAVGTTLLPAAENVIAKIDTLLTTVNTLLANPAIEQSVSRLDDITLNLQNTMRTINRTTAKLPPLVTSFNTTGENIATLTGNLADFSGELKTLPVDSTMQNLLVLSENLRKLSEELDNPNSTLGALMTDRSLYNNLETASASLDALLKDVKANPKRYISIKVF